MIKRTLYFSNPSYLSKKNNQLIFDYPENKEIAKRVEEINTVPIEDIGIVILDNQQITVTHGLLASLLDNNCALVTCDTHHMPNGLFMPLVSNQLQNEKFRAQLNASEPLIKQLWAQTISAKIRNQAAVLRERKVHINNMLTWAKKVRSGDPDNYEGRAAAYYWKNFFPMIPEFIRDRYGDPPNNIFNYVYAILRSVVARSLVGSGLLPTLGIHHANKYNPYCLADDIMEPYRPIVDRIIYEIVSNGEDFYELSTSIKKQLLSIPVIDVIIEGNRSPLMVGVQTTTSSLAKCFEGKARKILYPEMI